MKKSKCYILHCLLAIIGLVLLILAFIGIYFVPNLLGVRNPIFFLHVANSFFLMSIVSRLLCSCSFNKDENCDKEKK